MSRLPLPLFIALLCACSAQSSPRNADWPVYQGNNDHTHYTTLSEISPANVAQLKVAWTYDTKDAFPGSEMQSNPVIVNGVMYAMTPKQRAFALDAATGKELWSFDPTGGKFTGPRIRYRGIVVHDGRVYFNYRYRLFSIDAKSGLKVLVGGTTVAGSICARPRAPHGRTLSKREHTGCCVQGRAHHRHVGAGGASVGAR